MCGFSGQFFQAKFQPSNLERPEKKTEDERDGKKSERK